MSIRTTSKGFTIIEVFVASLIVLFLGIGLAKGILDLMRYNLKIKLKQVAVESVEKWANYIRGVPYDSWIISPDPTESPGGGDLYCYDCAFNRGFCDKQKRNWLSNQQCSNPNDPNCYFCSFMDPNYTVSGEKPYDKDGDGVIAIIDPYSGNNNCKDGAGTCSDSDMKYRYPTWYMAGWMRFLPDWGQGSSDCACRLGNCRNYIYEWQSYDLSKNYRIPSQHLGDLQCVYQLSRYGGLTWNPSVANKVFVGMGIINYYYVKNPVREAGKAIGIVAWYFDPIDKRYTAVTKIVFKERP